MLVTDAVKFRAVVINKQITKDVWLGALCKFKIATMIEKKMGNGRFCQVLKMTSAPFERETVKIFRLLFVKFKNIDVVFDLLNIFHNV